MNLRPWLLGLLCGCFLLAHAQDFNPTLETRCQNGFLNVTVLTGRPFLGIIYAEGRRQQCAVRGVGGLYTTFVVPLTDTQRCALVYEPTQEEHYTIINVREHPKIILDQDRTFNVSCLRSNSQQQRRPGHTEAQTMPNRELDTSISMGVYSQNNRKVHRTLFGYAYELRVTSAKAGQDFIVNSCTGFAGMNYTVELSDANGCTLSTELMSNFMYDPVNGIASSQLKSMFRFPGYTTVHLQCEITMCDALCQRVNCERRRDYPFEQQHFPRQSGGRAAGGSQRFTSTTISVDDVSNKTELYVREDCSSETRVLTILCVLFGVALCFALLTNIVGRSIVLAFCYLGGFLCYLPKLAAFKSLPEPQPIRRKPEPSSAAERDAKLADYYNLNASSEGVYSPAERSGRHYVKHHERHPHQRHTPKAAVSSTEHSPATSSGSQQSSGGGSDHALLHNGANRPRHLSTRIMTPPTKHHS